MKNRFILFLLPFLMVLSACSNAPIKKSFANDNLLLEDTEAHEEIFSDGNLDTCYPIQDLLPRRKAEDLEKPHIGYQVMKYEEDTKYAVRFVAAVASLNVTATWHRGLSKRDSDQSTKPISDSGIVATKAYVTLNNNGEPASVPSDFGAKYNYLLVYSMYNIPNNADFSDGYIAAYLELDDGESKSYSDVLVARIAGGNDFTIDRDRATGYFIQGKVNGTKQTIAMDDEWEKDGNPDGNAAEKQLALLADDEFGIFYYQKDTIFQFIGANTFNKETYWVVKAALNDYMTTRVNGTYRFYVKPFSNEIYTSCKSTSVNLYLHPGTNWQDGSATFKVKFVNADTLHNLVLEDDVEKIYKYEGFDAIANPRIQFQRWSSDGGSWWGETSVMNFTDNGNPTKTLLTVANDYWGGGSDPKAAGTWSVLS